VKQLRSGQSVSKEQVVREMAAKAEDTDIVTTSSVMSLKCPLSYTRLNTPCRGPKCSHNSCFDALSYLQLQEQATTWTCPICNSAAPFKQLFVDLYVTDILKSTPSSVEQVTIEPDGSWHQIREGSGEAHDSGDDSEIEIVEEQPRMPLKVESLAVSNGFNGTPSYQSREQSTLSFGMPYSTNTQSPHSRGQSTKSTSIQAPSSGGKRKSEVIDLTLSDDDDDDVPLRGPKRQMTNTSQPADHNYAMNGYGASPNGFSPQQVLNLGQPRPPPSRLQSSEEPYPYHWQ
jgi:E3 SUMO-protein ligase PIAS1